MSDCVEIERWAIEEFEFLSQLGFSKPVTHRPSPITVINWFYERIAFELELDGREVTVSALLVRLEGNQLPDGYYISNGQPCRYHLVGVIRQRGWPVDHQLLDRIIGTKKGRNLPRNLQTMKERVSTYKAIVMACGDRITLERGSIFPSAAENGAN